MHHNATVPGFGGLILHTEIKVWGGGGMGDGTYQASVSSGSAGIRASNSWSEDEVQGLSPGADSTTCLPEIESSLAVAPW